jgi:glyoxylase-like metal-dependent hydrolase (beta-lactamase superfamily II)
MPEKINPFLTYPVAATPEPGKAVQIQPGIFWIRLPIPFELNHINVWLLQDGDGYTLVDTGISSNTTREAWQHILKEVLNNRPIKRIIVTHFHPDHFGLARWLCELTGAEYAASEETGERTNFLLHKVDHHTVDVRAAFYEQHGIDDLEIFENFLKGNLYAAVVSGIPDKHSVLGEGESIIIGDKEWRVIMAYGHAPGHITLYCEALNLLISGDQILPTITSNISVYADQPDANPLDEYLESFKKFDTLPEDITVLPSHGKVFQGLRIRIGEIVGHHHQTLEKIHSTCEQAHSVMELVPKLFRRKLEGINSVLAFGETLAHLNYLCAEQRLQRKLESGKYIYQQ